MKMQPIANAVYHLTLLHTCSMGIVLIRYCMHVLARKSEYNICRAVQVGKDIVQS